MKCARLHLQQRTKPESKLAKNIKGEKPRRICQKRLVNPEHEEDPRWTDVFERFHCNDEVDQLNETVDSYQIHQTSEDLFLTVQTLKFEGGVDKRKRPRTSFKYKTITDTKHRMFVKQTIQNQELNEEECSSQITYYYFDDYVKYLFNNDRSRPASGKSTLFLQGLSSKLSENKATQVDIVKHGNYNKETKIVPKFKNTFKNIVKDSDNLKDMSESNMEDAKITYRKFGKRKSLTISRTESPETVQVIRVDVVCNYSNSNSVISDYDDNKKVVETLLEVPEKKTDILNSKKNHFANKYLLTKTIKSLDEKLSGGAKVTLLCKTFKLSDRVKMFDKYKSPDISFPKIFGKGNKTKVKK